MMLILCYCLITLIVFPDLFKGFSLHLQNATQQSIIASDFHIDMNFILSLFETLGRNLDVNMHSM